MFETIEKQPSAGDTAPNLPSYKSFCESFSWQHVRHALGIDRAQTVNIADIAVDRQVREGRGDQMALRWLSKDGTATDYTYSHLAREISRFTGLLRSLGVEPKERVFSLLGRVPALYIAALGTLKAGCVYSPLFSAFGPEPIRSRMEIGEASVLVTSRQLYEKKVAPWRDELPSLKHVLLTDPGEAPLPDGCVDLSDALEKQPATYPTHPTRGEDMALLHFTSGTTGKPKGAIHVHEAVVSHYETGRLALDMKPGDVFWCTADPGWVTGTSYGIISPLANGLTMIVDEAEFDPENWYRTLERQKVTIWYTAPTAIRMLMKAGDELVRQFDLTALRFLSSVGEPLNPEAVVWSQKVFGKPFHDNWWQTETGGIMIANFAAEPVKPGSMGMPMPGTGATIVEKQEDGSIVEVAAPMVPGELALKAGWPSMFRGYLNNEARYIGSFKNGWYLTGDLAMRDEDGYYWFVGRADDMIKSSGHLIGPFEVESALIEHEAVAEAAVIGIPDERAGEIVKGYVTLNAGYTWGDALRKDILAHARRTLGPAVAPRELVWAEKLPKTRSGKIMRRLLKARELGLPEGDTSTLEGSQE